MNSSEKTQPVDNRVTSKERTQRRNFKKRKVPALVLSSAFVVGCLAALGTTQSHAQLRFPDSSTSGDFGSPANVTATTIPKLVKRASLADSIVIAEAITNLRRSHLDDWSGFRVGENGGTTSIQILAKPGAVGAIRKQLSDVLSDRKVEIDVQPSMANEKEQLAAVEDAISGSNVSSAYFDPFSGKLHIRPQKGKAFDGNSVTSIRGKSSSGRLKEALIQVEEPESVIPTVGGEAVRVRLANGTLQTGVHCTSGWGIYRPSDGAWGYMTAGHCYAMGTPINGSTVSNYHLSGNIANGQLSTSTSARKTAYYWDHVAVYNYGSWNTFTGDAVVDMAANNAHLGQGQGVCWYGRSTGRVCGTTGPVNVVLNISTGANGVPGQPYTLYGFELPGVCQAGDSGGPLWLPPSTSNPNSASSLPLGYVVATTASHCYGLSLDDALSPLGMGYILLL